LLATALLRANGVRVMAVDIAPQRRRFAQSMGAERTVILGEQDLREEARSWTDGYGVDAVVLAAASPSNSPAEQALEALRDRGRIIVVGKTKVDLPWESAYAKEIDVRYSRSYGPGRYDPDYEWAGADYPMGYVRWTEQRNFDACLQLMKSGDLDLAALTTSRAPFADALNVYRRLLGDASANEAGVILEYGDAAGDAAGRVASAAATQSNTIAPRVTGSSADDRPRRLEAPVTHLDVIGAGNFARTMLLPHLRGAVPFGTVVNHTALSANHVRTKFGFEKAATDPGALLDASFPASNTAVLIATRHHLHAPLVTAALASQRHVFVEKPLCLTRTELATIDAAVARSQGSVQVGFNRRFSGAGVCVRDLLRAAPGPKSASFRVMAGALDPTSWYANHAESGGRIVGEACHFLDFFCFLFESQPVRVAAVPLGAVGGRQPSPDSISAQIEFADGSSGQLIYSAAGDASWPKEVCTVFAAGMTAEISNFKTVTIHRQRRHTNKVFEGKGHAEQMAAWAAFLRGEAPHPLPYNEIRRSTQLTFAVLDALASGRTVAAN
jgi:predicted dehydrogenase